MKMVHGTVEFDVPDHWNDASTLVFTDPQNLQAPMATRVISGQAPPNIVVKFMPPTNAGLSAFLDQQLTTAIAPSLPGFAVVQKADAGTEADPIPYVIYRANPGQAIQQIVGCRHVGGRLMLLTAGALEAQFAAVLPVALRTLKGAKAPT
jgi:hypothetical protein